MIVPPFLEVTYTYAIIGFHSQHIAGISQPYHPSMASPHVVITNCRSDCFPEDTSSGIAKGLLVFNELAM